MKIHAFIPLVVGILLLPGLKAQTPVAYWKFDDPNAPWIDDINGDNHLFTKVCNNVCQVLPTAAGGPGGNHLLQTKDDHFFTVLHPTNNSNCVNLLYGGGGDSQAGMTSQAADALSVEFLFQSGCDFARSYFIDWDNRLSLRILEDRIIIDLETTSQPYNFQILLSGIDRRSIGYYSDMEWHHMVLTFDRYGAGAQGEVRLYVDGVCHPDFIFHTNNNDPLNNPGYLYIPGSPRTCGFDPPHSRFDGHLDEYAIYSTVLSENVVLEHYFNFFPGVYNSCLGGVPAPNVQTSYNFGTTDITSTIVACALASIPSDLTPEVTLNYPQQGTITDEFSYLPEEFAPNYPDVTITAHHPLRQLQEYPVPRYLPDYTMHQNHVYTDLGTGIKYVWKPYDSQYLGIGNYDDYMLDVADELIQHFNYGLFLGTIDQALADELNDNTSYSYKAAEYAVANPGVQRFMNANWGPVRDYNHFLASNLSYDSYMSQNLVANANRDHVSDRDKQPLEDHYLIDQNSGQPISIFHCAVSPNISNRMWDPSEPAVGPLMHDDGESLAGWLHEYFEKGCQLGASTCLRTIQSNWNNSLDFLKVNNEQLLWTGCAFAQNDLSFDNAAQNCCGSLYEGGGYLFTRYMLNEYRDGFLNAQLLGQDLGSSFRYAVYDISGKPTYLGPISKTWDAHSQNGFATDNYLTPYYYPQRQYYWYKSALPGTTSWVTLVAGRQPELTAGLDLFTASVSPGSNVGGGYTVADYQIMRPGSYLGMLKAISMLGAENFVAFTYNTDGVAGNEHHGEWNIYQMAIPGYAQAITSRYHDILSNSVLLEGDFHEMATTQGPAYSFSTGNVNDLVVVREEWNAQNTAATGRFAIMGTTQRGKYYDPEGFPFERNVKIELGGTELHFGISRQGNTYIYDRDPATYAPVNVTKPHVFYQLDAWHEWRHPSHWSRDFAFEAEVFDGNAVVTGANGLQSYEAWTEVPNPAQITPSREDYTDYTTYMTWWNSTTECFESLANRPSLEYRFVPRVSDQQQLRFYVRARAKGGVATGLDIEVSGSGGPYQSSIACITDPAWQWYGVAVDGTVIAFSSLQLEEYILKLLPTNSALEIDRILLTAIGSPNAPSLANATSCVPPVASFTFNQDPCVNSHVVQFTNTSTVMAACVDYLWDFGDNNTSTQEHPTHSYGSPGTYTVTLTVTYPGGGMDQVSQTVTVTGNLYVTATPDPIEICVDECIEISANTTGGTPPYTYSWTHYYTVGGQATSSSAGSSEDICFVGNGSYTNQSLSVEVQDVNGCTTSYTLSNVSVLTGESGCVMSMPNGCCEGGGTQKQAEQLSLPVLPVAGIKVFPNPAHDQLIVALDKWSSSEDVTIEVTDVHGRLVKSFAFDAFPGSVSLSIVDLEDGSYLVHVHNGEGVIGSQAFVKQ